MLAIPVYTCLSESIYYSSNLSFYCMHIGQDYIGVTVSFFCHDGAGHFLLNKRSLNCRDEHGRWDPGGGKIEFGDTVVATLHREIKEEYCVDVLEYAFLGFRDVHRVHDGKPTHWISLDYKVLVDRSKVKNGEPNKFDELEWFTLDNLPQPLHSQFDVALKEYSGKL